ncbi:hypothetical protein [Hymenobacter nivis]|uniref:hypothetical protein n=1 Tax=Hymenobacter nivis TaxID=1850093 RepID=UPI00112C55C8|nr:hypothetical protein [Hymenobacter nivis]
MRYFIVLLLACLSLSVTAQKSTGQRAADSLTLLGSLKPVKPPGPPARMDAPMSEKDYYRKMYELSQKEVEALRSDVRWAVDVEVGVVLGVVAFLLGAQYLNNVRINTQKLGAVETRLTSALQNQAAETRTVVADTQRAALAQLSTGFAENQQELRALANQIESKLRETFTREIAEAAASRPATTFPQTPKPNQPGKPIDAASLEKLNKTDAEIQRLRGIVLSKIDGPNFLETDVRPLAEAMEVETELSYGTYNGLNALIPRLDNSILQGNPVITEFKTALQKLKRYRIFQGFSDNAPIKYDT